MQDYDEALSSGGKENKLYTYNKWKKCVCQEERKQEKKTSCEAPGGLGHGENMGKVGGIGARGKGRNSLYGT